VKGKNSEGIGELALNQSHELGNYKNTPRRDKMGNSYGININI